MAIRLTIDEIKSKIIGFGKVEVLSDTYTNIFTPLTCRCLICNEEFLSNYSSLRSGTGHNKCSIISAANKIRCNLEEIKIKALSLGTWEIVDTKYVGSEKLLDVICTRHKHKRKMSWDNIKANKNCGECSKLINRQRLTYSFVKHSFESKHYKLLSTMYHNSEQQLDYECPKGHLHSMKWGNWSSGKRCPTCHDERLTYEKLNASSYKTFSKDLSTYEVVVPIEVEDLTLLGVHCTYCNKIFTPTRLEVKNRLLAINTIDNGECRFYCSQSCKQACPIYYQSKTPGSFVPTESREMQPQFRKIVLERDDWTCQKCGTKDSELHAHHIDPVINNPVESCDIDNGITLCKTCHETAHQIDGCRLSQLQCKEILW